MKLRLPHGGPVALAGIVFLASGACALVYQVAWQRILALHSGVGLGNGVGMLYQAMRGHSPLVVIAGEITIKKEARGALEYERIARDVINDIGYNRAKYGFDCDTCGVIISIKEQSADIALGVNKALEAKPADMTITTHVCRGNFRSTFISSGGYEPVAENLLAKCNYDGYFLEYDTDRAGGFEPLRFVPKGKTVVLGLVTSKSGRLEGKDAIKRRIDQAAKFIPLDQLCLSPQCGFAYTEEGNLLAEANGLMIQLLAGQQ